MRVPQSSAKPLFGGRDGTKNDLEKTVQRLRADLGAEGYRLTTTRAGYQRTV